MQQKYAMMVRALTKDGATILAEMTPLKAHLDHMVKGIGGEAGELIDAVKKHTVYGKPIDREHVVEEMGDLEFYMEGLRESLGISREEVLTHNMSKLAERYARGAYSDTDAILRADKVKQTQQASA